MDFLEKLNYLMQQNGLNKSKLSKACNIPYTTIDGWYKKGYKGVKLTTLRKLSDYFDVPLDFWANEEDTPSPVHTNSIFDMPNIFPIQTTKIPLLGEIACGKPIFASEERESYIMAGTEIHADFCLKAKGDSMTGARIMDGDIVFIRQQDMVENGEIAAVIIDDEATLKRVYYYPEENKLALMADNPSYAPMIYVGEELNHIHILGKAIAFQSNVI